MRQFFGGGGPRSVVALGGRDRARPSKKGICRKRRIMQKIPFIQTSFYFVIGYSVPALRLVLHSLGEVGSSKSEVVFVIGYSNPCKSLPS